jgi:hypothetical protein
VSHLKSIHTGELEEGHLDQCDMLLEYHSRAYRDFDALCQRAVTLITKELLPLSPDAHSRAFDYKKPGDIARYHAECAKEPPVQELLRHAMLNYEKSLEICAEAFPLRHPLRLAAIANRVVLE